MKNITFSEEEYYLIFNEVEYYLIFNRKKHPFQCIHHKANCEIDSKETALFCLKKVRINNGKAYSFLEFSTLVWCHGVRFGNERDNVDLVM